MTQDEAAKSEPSKDEPSKDAPAAASSGDGKRGDPTNWVLRIVLVLIALVAAYAGFRLAAAFFPRWWSQRVADQVQGDFSSGTWWGLFYGFVFTFVPLLLLFQIRRRFFSWTWRLIVFVVAILLAAPNWLTLSVVLGTSKAAHAGERIMDVDAPNFRVSTLIGAIAGAVLVIVITAMSVRMKQRKKQVERLKGERDELRRAASDSSDESR